ncbi:MAG: ATP-dependent RecD-like DNA helicase [Lachnospiraceae bacterium]|nr:ATP-dependent RecD-like DNA helicase [Lachnospiraceae bacterium]
MQLNGIVDHIIFRNPENLYTVLSFNADDGGEYVCVGSLPELDKGESVTFEGEIKENPKYGTQFSVRSYTIAPPDDAASILRYLSSGAVKGVGPGLAKRIVSKFGEDSFRIIEEEPERLSEIKGISMRMAIEISGAFESKAGSRQAMSFLSQYDISANLGQKIYEKYKDQMYEIIRTNPYRMIDDIDGVGFITADRIASDVGIEKGSEYRIRSAILYLLAEAAGSGSLCMPENDLITEAERLLGVEKELIVSRLDSLSIDRQVIREETNGALLDYGEGAYYAETETARLLTDLDIPDSSSDRNILDEVSRIERELDITLEDAQREAVTGTISNTVSVITGGPGTGKTTITNFIIRYYTKQGLDITLAAPTGRAAKRMTEATGFEAKTIHRLLGVGMVVEGKPVSGFEHNSDNPLETDVIIVDEMSMVDIYIFRSLLRAIVPGTRVILVGDADQLPSVGPGAVLKDIIASDCFHVTRLTKIYRQSEASAIVRNAHSVIEGRSIDFNEQNKDFFLLKRNDAERIIQGIVYLISRKLPGHLSCEPMDIQVMTPMRKGVLGVENLNLRLQEALNPSAANKRELGTVNGILRSGDKVMQTKNDYEMDWELTNGKGMVLETGKGVYNGDIGKVLSVSSEEAYIRFDDGREARYRGEALSNLELAYAITIHKSQGSEYRAVILPLLSGPRMLMNRNLLYTAITRAKHMVCILGSEDTVNMMIRNEREESRYTGLERRIREIKDIGSHI